MNIAELQKIGQYVANAEDKHIYISCKIEGKGVYLRVFCARVNGTKKSMVNYKTLNDVESPCEYIITEIQRLIIKVGRDKNDI